MWRAHVSCAAAGIEIALEKKVEWILHVDTDELMYPGGAPDYSLQRILASYEDDVDTVVFPNYESLPERDDVKDPFTEVSSITHQLRSSCLPLLHATFWSAHARRISVDLQGNCRKCC